MVKKMSEGERPWVSWMW